MLSLPWEHLQSKIIVAFYREDLALDIRGKIDKRYIIVLL
jgi:hypothetical protein